MIFSNLVELANISHCPICEKEISKMDLTTINKRSVNNGLYCKNKCLYFTYKYHGEEKEIAVSSLLVFKEDLRFRERKMVDLLNEKIAYWKEDFRYVAELLERS